MSKASEAAEWRHSESKGKPKKSTKGAYSASDVRSVGGSVPLKPYTLPPALVRASTRAAAVQPRIASLTSKSQPEDDHE
jgi:hypothetical protein